MEWRTHPALAGKLHPNHPDDIQVIIHDGGRRMTSAHPELAWVSITGVAGDIFSGRVIIAPTQLETVRINQSIRFIATGTGHPVMVSEKYLKERGSWLIHGCSKCGFAELFDAPSDLIKVIFPALPADAALETFTSFCPLCDGVQAVASRHAPPPDSERPWWKLWG
ncbi:hypothetical protein IV454_23075 [Massilia antarctica]|uniref:Uncharacterized protein n=1 Tax=Massilia antarctica TaxID=2765360 RepID=A0AA48WBE8_9BURK|nr:hypothetical protein [Massilia antarctica]QPI48397.1 hypothetical protein IV454_23075 [Massilia antarctica]